MDDPAHRPAFVPRRWFFLNPLFRGKFWAGAGAAAVFSAALLAVDYYVFFGRNAPTSPWDPDMIWIFLKAHRPLVVQLLVFVFVLAGLMGRLSQRVAGPLVGLERSIRIVAEGNLVHRARFREKDELPGIRDAFNALVEATHEKVRNDREIVAAVRREIEPLLSSPGVDPSTRAALEKIKARLERVTRGFTL